MWVRSRRCACLVTWFWYQLIANPDNKTVAPLWPCPYHPREAEALNLTYHCHCFTYICNPNTFGGGDIFLYDTIQREREKYQKQIYAMLLNCYRCCFVGQQYATQTPSATQLFKDHCPVQFFDHHEMTFRSKLHLRQGSDNNHSLFSWPVVHFTQEVDPSLAV